jgi:vesicle transport protein SEC22
MPLLTIISRIPDALILSEDVDSNQGRAGELDLFRDQAKRLIKTLNRKSQQRMTVESGPFYFAYYIENDVVYLTLCEKSFSRKLAFKFLEELQKEFDIGYGADVPSAKRPYAFIKFGNIL